MIRIDFHVHTNSSLDSTIKPEELAGKAKQLGIVPAVTDHSTTASWEKMESTGAVFIRGEEVRTTSGDLVGLFLTEEIQPKLSFEETVDKIRGQGGLVYLPHMYDTTRYGCGDEYAHLVDIIEVFNARCMGGRFNERAAEAAGKLGKPGAAGSDSHFLLEFGTTYNEMPEFDMESPAELMRILKSGRMKMAGKNAPPYVRGTTSLVKLGRKIKKKLGLGKDIK